MFHLHVCLRVFFFCFFFYQFRNIHSVINFVFEILLDWRQTGTRHTSRHPTTLNLTIGKLVRQKYEVFHWYIHHIYNAIYIYKQCRHITDLDTETEMLQLPSDNCQKWQLSEMVVAVSKTGPTVKFFEYMCKIWEFNYGLLVQLNAIETWVWISIQIL